MLPLSMKGDPKRQDDQLEIEPEALPRDVEGLITKRRVGKQDGIAESQGNKAVERFGGDCFTFKTSSLDAPISHDM